MLDFDINQLMSDVADIEKQRDLQADIKDSDKIRKARIKAYFKNQKALVRWGIDLPKTESFKPINEAHIVESIANRDIDGRGLISDIFINHCLMTFESKVKAQCVRVNGLQVKNLNNLKRTLKSLKGRKNELINILNKVEENESIKFIDKTLSLRFIINKLIEGLTIIIDKGYAYKQSKRYVSLCSGADTPSIYVVDIHNKFGGGLILADKTTGKANSKYRQANHKMRIRQIRQLNYMPIITYKEGKMDRIEFYSRKQLPLYLQD